MAGAEKHALRSHRGYRKNTPFMEFSQRALKTTAYRRQKKSIAEMLKSLFHKTTDK